MPHPDLIKVGKGRRKKKRLKGYMDTMRGYGEDMYGGETSTRPVAGIFAPFAKSLVTRLACIEDEGNMCFYIVSVTLNIYMCFHIVFVLHNK